MSHYSWTKESRTLDKKLNGKKTNSFGFLELVSEDYPKCCPCCGVRVPSFSLWIFTYKELEIYRNKSLPFLDDLSS
ncbi:hypothetical protein H8356DRAFT_1340183 [Neocallimastix lanati (nom. inval.)]|nr:hypothetical protein H8356DRAFT_1340183 [Neocallimastix sp. JGI-2020a]